MSLFAIKNKKNCDESKEILTPVREKKIPNIGQVAIMTATYPDINRLCDIMNIDKQRAIRFDMSKVYQGTGEYEGISIVGPFVGAPQAVMILEKLILCGVSQVIFVGWCGAISEKLQIGDIFLPDSAIIDEGTSQHYGASDMSFPEKNMTEKLEAILTNLLIPNFKKGKVWSTDAIYRETVERVKYYREKGALAVEMEASALFSAGKFRNIGICSLMSVSDELTTFTWKPGFTDEKFNDAGISVCKIAIEFAKLI